MIAVLLSVINTAWRRALPCLALVAAIALFFLNARRTGEKAARASQRLHQTERTNDALRRMLEAGADRPRDRDDLAQRLRDGRF